MEEKQDFETTEKTSGRNFIVELRNDESVNIDFGGGGENEEFEDDGKEELQRETDNFGDENEDFGEELSIENLGKYESLGSAKTFGSNPDESEAEVGEPPEQLEEQQNFVRNETTDFNDEQMDSIGENFEEFETRKGHSAHGAAENVSNEISIHTGFDQKEIETSSENFCTQETCDQFNCTPCFNRSESSRSSGPLVASSKSMPESSHKVSGAGTVATLTTETDEEKQEAEENTLRNEKEQESGETVAEKQYVHNDGTYEYMPQFEETRNKCTHASFASEKTSDSQSVSLSNAIDDKTSRVPTAFPNTESESIQHESQVGADYEHKNESENGTSSAKFTNKARTSTRNTSKDAKSREQCRNCGLKFTSMQLLFTHYFVAHKFAVPESVKKRVEVVIKFQSPYFSCTYCEIVYLFLTSAVVHACENHWDILNKDFEIEET